MSPRFDVKADLSAEIERVQDLYEAAAREASLIGDGAVHERAPARCPRCGILAASTWFRSRGFVCVWCEEALPRTPR